MGRLKILFIWWGELSNLLFLFSGWVNTGVSVHMRTEALDLTGAGVTAWEVSSDPLQE